MLNLQVIFANAPITNSNSITKRYTLLLFLQKLCYTSPMKTYKKHLLHGIPHAMVIDVRGTDTEVSSIEYDSRKVQAGAVFFAFPGLHTDGEQYIADAIHTGAIAIVHQNELPSYAAGVCYVRVREVRAVMSAFVAYFYDFPSKDLVVIGVTGTEGKSSTVSFIAQLLRLAHKRAGFFSTVSYSLGDEVIPNPEHQTTPESVTVQQRLAAMRDNGCEFAVVESSSHGLSPLTARLNDVCFDAGIFMNVTQEHLEFHGTFEQYRFDKANLFRKLDEHAHIKAGRSVPSFGVVNADDPSAEYFYAATKQPCYSFSVNTAKKTAFLKNELQGVIAVNIKEDSNGIQFDIFESGKSESIHARAPLAGLFNVQNLCASLLTVSSILQKPLAELIPLLQKLEPITGRMCKIQEGQPFEVLIDYAHTPSSFQMLMPPIKDRIAKQGGKLIVVFGSGGERDTKKRPEQGRIAAAYCDVIILADEDPRGEDPVALLEMIAAGAPHKKLDSELFIIPDRKAAIRKAFSLANPHDAVLLLGKGHENTIIYKNGAIPYSEEEIARTLLRQNLEEKDN
ncbi:UDP-N-acetylmuramoyl-L-alanyl-D-glutamate--2,6-diaminopimelate ligase [Treponema phagedenis F0421]|nr:UDP-N-acetylmuramoyl-L-alanyl-D-glutamate--2,6-diaminopimelate ligase [Treponema phagedenis F0421]